MESWLPKRCRRQVATSSLCSALEAANVSTLLFIGDSTIANVFVASIYNVLPGGSWDSLDTPMLSDDLHGAVGRCWKDRRDTFMGRDNHFQWSLGRTSLRQQEMEMLNGSASRALFSRREKGPCTYARRCAGKLTLEFWNAGNEDAAAPFLVRESLREMRAKRRLPDAIVWTLGAHYMGTADATVRYSGVVDAFLDSVAPAAARHVFFNQGYPGPKAAVWRDKQSACDVFRLNRVAEALVASRRMDVLDFFELSQAVGGAHMADAVHYDEAVCSALGAVLLHAITLPGAANALKDLPLAAAVGAPAPLTSSEELPGADGTEECHMVIHGVFAVEHPALSRLALPSTYTEAPDVTRWLQLHCANRRRIASAALATSCAWETSEMRRGLPQPLRSLPLLVSYNCSGPCWWQSHHHHAQGASKDAHSWHNHTHTLLVWPNRTFAAMHCPAPLDDRKHGLGSKTEEYFGRRLCGT